MAYAIVTVNTLSHRKTHLNIMETQTFSHTRDSNHPTHVVFNMFKMYFWDAACERALWHPKPKRAGFRVPHLLHSRICWYNAALMWFYEQYGASAESEALVLHRVYIPMWRSWVRWGQSPSIQFLILTIFYNVFAFLELRGDTFWPVLLPPLGSAVGGRVVALLY